MVDIHRFVYWQHSATDDGKTRWDTMQYPAIILDNLTIVVELQVIHSDSKNDGRSPVEGMILGQAAEDARRRITADSVVN